MPESRRLLIDQGDEIGSPCRLTITTIDDGNFRLTGSVTLDGTRHLDI